jgi:hypothetical protein
LKEPIVTLSDHGYEINLISKKLYEKGKWPVEIENKWLIQAWNNSRGDLYRACLNVKVIIGNVSVVQNFFVQDMYTYLSILGQPFIIAIPMETKVLDDGYIYARIRSQDGKWAVQFLTICPNHKRNCGSLRDQPLPKVNKVYIHPLCPIKEICVCAFIIAVLCDVQSILHSYAISIIHAKFHLLKSIYGEFIHVFFIISCKFWLKDMSDEFLKVDCTNRLETSFHTSSFLEDSLH